VRLLSRLGQRDARALRLGALVLVPVLGYGLLARPYWRGRDRLSEAVRVQRDLLVRERALLEDARSYPALGSEVAAAAGRESRLLFQGPSAPAAGGELVSYVGEAARRNRVLVQELATRPAEVAPGALARLQVELRAQSDLEGVLGFLVALERGPRLVRVEALAVERTEAWAGDAQADRETLTLRAAISGVASAAVAAAAGPGAR